MERYSFMEAHIDDRFYMDFSRRREPDYWVNVYDPSGPYEGSPVTSRYQSNLIAAPGRLYRLRIYLKQEHPDV